MNKKIIICDDDEAIVDVLTTVVADQGFSVLSVNEATKLHEAVIYHKPAMALVDLHMNGTDCVSVIQQIKNDQNATATKIVIISGDSNIESITKESRADGYLAKPFSIEEVEILLSEKVE